MHKNSYNAKNLCGNWNEDRFTEKFDQHYNATSNTFLPNPCKYIRPAHRSLSVFGLKYD